MTVCAYLHQQWTSLISFYLPSTLLLLLLTSQTLLLCEVQVSAVQQNLLSSNGHKTSFHQTSVYKAAVGTFLDILCKVEHSQESNSFLVWASDTIDFLCLRSSLSRGSCSSLCMNCLVPKTTTISKSFNHFDGSYDKQTCTENIKSTQMTKSSGPEMALVVYDEDKVPPIYRPVRSFAFENFNLSIKQSWNEEGISAVVWEAAVILASYMEQNQDSISGKSILELGSGTGLAGLAAGYLGAKVLLTDLEEALPLLKENVALNNNSSMTVSVAELRWGSDSMKGKTEKYDVILGADIVYIEETFADLLHTLEHFSNSNTVILLSSKIRYERDERFYRLLSEDFVVTEVFYSKLKDIHVYKATLKV